MNLTYDYYYAHATNNVVAIYGFFRFQCDNNGIHIIFVQFFGMIVTVKQYNRRILQDRCFWSRLTFFFFL